MQIALLHTADVHVPRFAATFAGLDASCQLEHVVRADLLDRARAEGLAAVTRDFDAALAPLLTADALLCTCSTLGPLVDALQNPRAVRIDRPMMEAACRIGPRIAVALCLESTRNATLALLQDTASGQGSHVTPTVIACTAAWAAFETGDMPAYHAQIAGTVREALAHDRFDCVILAQASMTDAATALADCGIPVLTAPEAAAKATLDAARGAL